MKRDTSLPYESIAIIAIVLLNAVLAFLHEERSGQALAALRAMSAAAATVERETAQR